MELLWCFFFPSKWWWWWWRDKDPECLFLKLAASSQVMGWNRSPIDAIPNCPLSIYLGWEKKRGQLHNVKAKNLFLRSGAQLCHGLLHEKGNNSMAPYNSYGYINPLFDNTLQPACPQLLFHTLAKHINEHIGEVTAILITVVSWTINKWGKIVSDKTSRRFSLGFELFCFCF